VRSLSLVDLMDSPLHHFLKRCDVRPAQSRSPLAAESSRFYAARTAKNPGFRTKSVPGRGYGMAENDRHFDPLVRITGHSYNAPSRSVPPQPPGTVYRFPETAPQNPLERVSRQTVE